MNTGFVFKNYSLDGVTCNYIKYRISYFKGEFGVCEMPADEVQIKGDVGLLIKCFLFLLFLLYCKYKLQYIPCDLERNILLINLVT